MAIMKAPTSGVTVRMYRLGHGDCFLLAFPPKTSRSKRPVFVLIDCGRKPKSEVKGQTIDMIIADIAEATDNRIDLVVVTHEHQDHVNGFLAKASAGGGLAFDPIAFGAVWLAWTEDDSDDFANELRDRFNDTLIGLAQAHMRLMAIDPGSAKLTRIEELLDLQIGDDGVAGGLALALEGVDAGDSALSASERLGFAIAGITNKRALKSVRDKSETKPTFLRPDRGPFSIPGVKGARVFAFGPPRDDKLLLSLNPKSSEEFKAHSDARAFALDGPSHSFFNAMDGRGAATGTSPFASNCAVPEDHVLTPHPAGLNQPDCAHYRSKYVGITEGERAETEWRRIDNDWLDQSDHLALRLNSEVNNTSLVLAIELENTGKVLLFTGDAQRGSWISWANLDWTVDGKTVTARDLLARTVLYKVGHHGSHNATLSGTLDDKHPNLSWMGLGDFADEFVAMIPANTAWALTKHQPWRHPLKAIEDALHHKADGRVFRSDIDKVARPDTVTPTRWSRFTRRAVETDLYLEYTVPDR